MTFRECGSTHCWDGTPSSTHQYKLLDKFSTNPTSRGSLWTYLYRASHLKSIIDFSGFSFMVEVSFWQLLKTVVSCDLFIIISEKSVISNKE